MDDEFKEILAKLRKPFPPELVEWKPQVISGDKARAQAVAFVDPRAYEERLDEAWPRWERGVEILKPDGSLVRVSI